MDGQRFDNIARLLAGGLTRRRLFTSLAAGALSTIPGLRRSASAEGECVDDTGCVDGGICCSGSCIQGYCCDEEGLTGNAKCVSGEMCLGYYCQPFNCELAGYCDAGICCNGECIQGIECCPFDNSMCDPGYECMSMGYCVIAPCDDCGGALCCSGVCDTTFTYECCPGTYNDCPIGMVCGSQGQCENATCDSAFDCGRGAAACCYGYCQPGWTCCPSDPYCPNEGEVCVDGGNGQWVCVPPVCTTDEDCATGICCQDGACYDGECCSFDSSPNPHCPADYVCFEGVCDKNQACIADTDCEAGSTCVDGACESGESATATGTTIKPTDKWKLWSDPEIRLQGANIYLRRLTGDDDDAEYGDAVIGPVYTKQDFERLAGYRANYVDISHPATYAEKSPYSVEPEVETSLAGLVKLAEEADLYVVISARTGPGRSESTPRGFPICRAGGCFGSDSEENGSVLLSSKLWDDVKAQDAWVAMWGALAKSYANDPWVIGYHLMAMPDAPDTKSYLALLAKIVATIRTADTETPILISAPGGGLPEDLKGIKPLEDDRIVYRFDTYAPKRYLRQESDAPNALAYGDELDLDEDAEEGTFDRAWLRAFLKPAQSWAETNKKPVAVGGYGMPRWQPELAVYLDDLVELFAKYEWSTGLWMWQPETGPIEKDAFNLEYGDDPGNHEATANPLLDVITQYWKVNKVRPSTGT